MPKRAPAERKYAMLLERNTPDFAIDGKRALRVMGACVCAAGLLLFAAGSVTAVFGRVAQQRYERKTGRLIRIFSREDQRNYAALKNLGTFGGAAMGAGVVIIICGASMLIRPSGAFRMLRILRILKPSLLSSPAGIPPAFTAIAHYRDNCQYTKKKPTPSLPCESLASGDESSA